MIRIPVKDRLWMLDSRVSWVERFVLKLKVELPRTPDTETPLLVNKKHSELQK